MTTNYNCFEQEVKMMIEMNDNSRMSTNWTNVSATWYDFVKMLCTVKRTNESFYEYQNATHDFKSKAKDTGAFVGGLSINNYRRKDTVTKRTMITLDADHIDTIEEKMRQMNTNIYAYLQEKLKDFMYVCYTTHSHSNEHKRLRVVINLNREVDVVEYEAIARRVAYYIDDTMKIWDNTTYQASRLMFLASASYDAEFIAFFNQDTQAKAIDADAVLATFNDYTNELEWNYAEDETIKERVKLVVRKNDDNKKILNLRNFFVSKFSIIDVIDTYLSDIYEESMRFNNRFTLSAGTQADGILYNADLDRTYHMNESDACAEKSCDSYDLIYYNLCSADELEMREWLENEGIYDMFVKEIKNLF